MNGYEHRALGIVRVSMLARACPDCGGLLTLRSGVWAHEVPLSRVMDGEDLCDFSEREVTA